MQMVNGTAEVAGLSSEAQASLDRAVMLSCIGYDVQILLGSNGDGADGVGLTYDCLRIDINDAEGSHPTHKLYRSPLSRISDGVVGDTMGMVWTMSHLISLHS